MVLTRRRFSERLLYDIKKIIFLRILFILLFFILFYIYGIQRDLSATTVLVRDQLRLNLLKMLNYGEILYIQPLLDSSVKSMSDIFDASIKIYKVQNQEVIAYSGAELDGAFFQRKFSERIYAPHFGEVDFSLTVNFSKKVQVAAFIFLGLFLVLLSLEMFMYHRLKKKVISSAFSVDQLESLIRNIDTGSVVPELESAKELIEKYASTKSQVVANQIISQLAIELAHDIRSPLSVMNILLSKIQLSSEQFDLFKQSLERISQISAELLSRVKTEKSYFIPTLAMPNSEFFGLSASIKVVLAEKKLLIEQRKIVFDSDIEGQVLGHRATFERIFSNLIQNSIEATKNHATSLIEIALVRNKEFMTLTISDNGKGIPKDVLSRIGEAGFSFDKVAGNGFGVSSAKSNISSWGGVFQLSSQVGVGTIVQVSLKLSSI